MEMQHATVMVTRNEAAELYALPRADVTNPGFESVYHAALAAAVRKAPVNHGFLKAHAGSTGWRFIFVKVR